MKNMVKKNQIMITALALMIAVAGYLNFAGTKITDEEIVTTGSDMVQNTEVIELNTEYDDIDSMDSELVLQEDNYLDQSMEEIMAEEELAVGSDGIEEQVTGSDVPGEAVFTAAAGQDSLSGAKLLKRQEQRARKHFWKSLITEILQKNRNSRRLTV